MVLFYLYHICYNYEIEDDVLALPDTLLARYLRLTNLMQEYGPDLGMPHTRAMGEGLFEIRMKGQEGIARAFYCIAIKNEILILHIFIKKQQETPLKELRVAKARLKEVKKYVKKIT
jgi:phage-related protein